MLWLLEPPISARLTIDPGAVKAETPLDEAQWPAARGEVARDGGSMGRPLARASMVVMVVGEERR